ncbi:unnamed protein product [Ilex paraguariensis]|uniref:C3H1-type domain-containing protein n=1 Tax=Ilex paraguariensis TaxID=185542 RepID=A0ABC8ULM0_9AQUA
MESEGYEEHLRLDSCTPEKSVENLLPDNPAVEGSSGASKISGPNETRQKEEPSTDGKRTPRDHGDTYHDSKAPSCGIGTMSAETSKPFSVSHETVTAAFSIKDCKGGQANNVRKIEDETKQMGMQSEKDIKQMEPRLTVPQLLRPRSLSPGSPHDVNKRPAIICSFFAKGWCIKGNSCRFLHIKDDGNATSRNNEGAVASTNQKDEIMADEGLGDRTGRSGLPGYPDATSSSIAQRAYSSDKIAPWEQGESPRWKSESQELPLYKCNTRSTSSSKDIGSESLRESWYLDDHGKYVSPILKGSSPICKTSSFPETLSSSSSYSTSFKEIASKRSQSMLNDHNFPVLHRSLDSSSNTSLLAAGILSSNDISSWSRSSPLSFSSSWNKRTLGAQKLLDSGREYGASKSALQRSSSPFLGYESETLSWTNASGDPLPSAGYKTKISSYDWEPSVPFRPSFFMTQSLSSPGSQYDPIRDSIEQPNLAGGFSKLSSFSQGTSIPSTHLWTNDDPVSNGTVDPRFSDNKYSVSSHHNNSDNVLDKDHYERYLSTTETETVGNGTTEQKKRNTLPKEEKLLNPAHVRDVTETDKLSSYQDSRFQSNGPRHKTGSKVDRSRKSSDMDAEYKTDGEVHKDSKAFKHFHAALVDFVKELVKPTWREGHLNKDAYKMIVKKAVEKVLNTLQPHQIPNTAESIKQYLSLSQPKIAKLVEGYVDKYGKS